MVAKDEATQAALAADLKRHVIDRRYLTLVHGLVAPDTGLVDAPLGRDARDRLRMTVTDRTGSRTAQTTFRTLRRFESRPGDEGYSLLECRLHTGRTHQVRVHLAYIRHPVVGDQSYGRRRGSADLGLHRQFLHAWRLELAHPVTRATLVVTDRLPSELAAALDELEDRTIATTAAGTDVLARLEVAPAASIT
jgi:23S rRNA pseudouridine1911/1915/1917 synthase